MSKPLLDSMIQKLMQIRQELGRIPSRPEFLKLSGYTTAQILLACNNQGFHRLLELSGLKYAAKGKRTNQEIRKEVFSATKAEAEKRTPVATPPAIYRNILVISDRHQPYAHKDANDFLIALNRKYEFDLVIDIGDAEDFHALSFHDSDSDLPSAGHELRAAIEGHKPLYAEFPKMMICESNHSSMIWRKGKHHGFPRHVLKPYREVLEAPEGWTWHHEIVVQMSNGKKCLFAHSYSSNVLQASQKRGMSCVQGHHHSKMGVQYWSNADGVHFAAQTGCLIDDNSFAFSYNKLGLDRPLLGCLRIENGVPHALPMFLDSSGRWNKKVP